jgi:hypothetical protein
MTFRRPPPPTREDIAAAKITAECDARGHNFPQTEPLRPTQTTASADGRRISQQRTRCRDCGTVWVQSWQGEHRSAFGGRLVAAVLTDYEAPEPGDVPHIADHAARVTDDELAAAFVENGYYADASLPPRPEDRAAGNPQTVELTVRVRAGQFYLLDDGQTPAGILPVPEDASGAGIVDTMPGATLLWTGLRNGPVRLTVVLAPADPGAGLRDYEDVVEISHRSTTGRLTIAELGGTAHTLPPLPGYGDYRLRYHARDAGTAYRTATSDHVIDRYLLQIWPTPRTAPVILRATSDWASPRATIRTAPPPPKVRPWRPA